MTWTSCSETTGSRGKRYCPYNAAHCYHDGMATSYGRMRSLVLTRQLLKELANADEPTELRFRAAELLKDYPSIADLDELNRCRRPSWR